MKLSLDLEEGTGVFRALSENIQFLTCATGSGHYLLYLGNYPDEGHWTPRMQRGCERSQALVDGPTLTIYNSQVRNPVEEPLSSSEACLSEKSHRSENEPKTAQEWLDYAVTQQDQASGKEHSDNFQPVDAWVPGSELPTELLGLIEPGNLNPSFSRRHSRLRRTQFWPQKDLTNEPAVDGFLSTGRLTYA